MAGKREVGIVAPLLWASFGAWFWLCFGSIAKADDQKGGGFELPCGYEITTIVPPPPNGQQILLYDLNDAGVAVGYANIGLDYRSCLWSESTGIVLLPEPWWVIESSAARINNNGWILVNGTGQKERGYVLIPVPESGYEIVEIDPASSPGQSKVYGINDKNEVVGLQSMGTPGGDPVWPVGGFKWSEELGKETILVPGYLSTQCNDINDDGVICGNVSQQSQAHAGLTSTRGFIATSEGVEIVDPSPPFTKSEAVRVNDQGTAIGSMRTHPPNGATLIGWRRAAGTTFEVLPPPQSASGWVPADIDAAGLIGGTVYAVPGVGGPRYPVTNGQAFVNLDQYLGYASGTRSFSAFWGDGAIILFGCNCAGCSCMTLMSPFDLLGDVDCDGVVGASDLGDVLNSWGARGAEQTADLNSDGIIDGADLGLLLSGWTTTADYPRSCASESLMVGGGGEKQSETVLTLAEVLEILGFSTTHEFVTWVTQLEFEEFLVWMERLGATEG